MYIRCNQCLHSQIHTVPNLYGVCVCLLNYADLFVVVAIHKQLRYLFTYT